VRRGHRTRLGVIGQIAILRLFKVGGAVAVAIRYLGTFEASRYSPLYERDDCSGKPVKNIFRYEIYLQMPLMLTARNLIVRYRYGYE
jgi:hypothetical protein